MSQLDKRRGSNLNRGQRTDRIYQLGMASAGLGVAGLVIAFTISFGLGLLLIIAAAVTGYLARKQLG